MSKGDLETIGRLIHGALAGGNLRNLQTKQVFALIGERIPGEGQQKWNALRKVAEAGFPGAVKGGAVEVVRFGRKMVQQRWLWSSCSEAVLEEWVKALDATVKHSPYAALADRVAKLETFMRRVRKHLATEEAEGELEEAGFECPATVARDNGTKLVLSEMQNWMARRAEIVDRILKEYGDE